MNIASLALSPDGKRLKACTENVIKELRSEKRKSSRVQAQLDRLITDKQVRTIDIHPIPREQNLVVRDTDCDESTPTTTTDQEPPDPLTGILAELKKIFDSEKNKKKNAKTRCTIILQLLNSTQKGRKQYTKQEAEEYINGIQEQIEAYHLKLQGKEKQICYSAKVLRVAMSLWIHSPATYEELRQAGWIITLPSQSMMHQLHKEFKVKDGHGVQLYV